MTKNPNNSFNEETLPDRPLECSECKKPITIRYTEIEKGKVQETCMCDECPFLQKKLKGIYTHPTTSASTEGLKGVACGDCGTTLEAFQMGHQLGCSHCYEMFGDGIVFELQSRKKLPYRVEMKKSIPLHIGRMPGEATKVSPSLKLIALNEALNDMLQKEDYEQAAKIRDQINEITDSELDDASKSENNDDKANKAD